jgi:transposase
MKRYEALETLFCKTDLSFAQKILNEPYRQTGSRGRPPRKPLGIFKAHIVKRLKHIPSDRMLVRQMWKDPRLKIICDIEADEPPYGIAVLSRFRSKVGPERLARIVDQAVEVLVAKGRIKGEAVALDSTFIKAYSRRNLDNRTGYSDPESRIGRAVKAKDLGYKLHLSIDSETMLPLSCLFASANQNEKRHSLTILERAKLVLKNSGAKLRNLIADSQYSDGKIRAAVDKAVIPYPSNQKPGAKDILRVDKKFRTFGPEDQKREYHKRPPIEAVNSFLKTQFSMATNKIRGLKQVTIYALFSILCLVLNREAAQNIGRFDKAVSPTYFNT